MVEMVVCYHGPYGNKYLSFLGKRGIIALDARLALFTPTVQRNISSLNSCLQQAVGNMSNNYFQHSCRDIVRSFVYPLKKTHLDMENDRDTCAGSFAASCITNQSCMHLIKRKTKPKTHFFMVDIDMEILMDHDCV